jgi:hypothetical protein
MRLVPLLPASPVTSIDQVVGVMTAIEGALPEADGVRCFNHLYLEVTRAVRTAIGQSGGFHDVPFLDRLDLVFAQLYFDMLAAAERDSSKVPPAWRPLLGTRSTAGISPLQFALAGMNAHINRDLPIGIVRVFEALGGSPLQADDRHEDFKRVNDILATVEATTKAEFMTGLVGAVDAVGAPVDDRVAMWDVRAAREAAWTNAKVIWSLRPMGPLHDDYIDRLDRFTGFASSALLVPVRV